MHRLIMCNDDLELLGNCGVSIARLFFVYRRIHFMVILYGRWMTYIFIQKQVLDIFILRLVPINPTF